MHAQHLSLHCKVHFSICRSISLHVIGWLKIPHANSGNNTGWTPTKKELLACIFREVIESGGINAVNAMTAAQAWDVNPEFSSSGYACNNFLSAFKHAQTAVITMHGAGGGAAEADVTTLTQGGGKVMAFTFCFVNFINTHFFVCIFSDSKCRCPWASV